MNNDVYLALGSNLGNREKNIAEAIRMISRMPLTRLKRVSNIYETEPVGYLDQGCFLNGAVMIETGLDALELLERLQYIELRLKRSREIRWGPRTIDIDILLYGELDIDSKDLTVPHPRMFERAFVLVPLKDVLTDGRIRGTPIDELIKKCDTWGHSSTRSTCSKVKGYPLKGKFT